MRPRPNKSVTLFSPGGRLLQVEYALNSVRMASTAVGVRGGNCVVLALEHKRYVPQMLESSGCRIFTVDKNLMMSYAGLTPDARVLIDRARKECQRHNVVSEDPVTIRHIAKYIANVQLKHTQKPDVRPFGVSCLVAGFNPDRTPHLYQTDPSGNYYEYTAASVGKSGRTAQEYLESEWSEEAVDSRFKTVKLAISALLQVARPGQANFEVSVLKRNYQLVRMDSDAVAEYVDVIEGEWGLN